MNLSYIIKEIENILDKCEEYGTYILKDIAILEKNEDEIEIFPIIDIDIEKEEKEITLISNELSEDSHQKKAPILLKDLYNRLVPYKKKYTDFELFSGSSNIQFDDEYYGRLDTPLVAFGVNEEDKEFVLIQSEKNE